MLSIMEGLRELRKSKEVTIWLRFGYNSMKYCTTRLFIR